MATLDELRARAELIAEEQQIGGNTSERVGEAFDMVADIIEAIAPEQEQAVLYNPQTPTAAQQAQARQNIGAPSVAEMAEKEGVAHIPQPITTALQQGGVIDYQSQQVVVATSPQLRLWYAIINEPQYPVHIINPNGVSVRWALTDTGIIYGGMTANIINGWQTDSEDISVWNQTEQGDRFVLYVDSADVTIRYVKSALEDDQVVLTRNIRNGAVTREKLSQELQEATIPSGGTAGQVLSKTSSSEYAVEWSDLPESVTDYNDISNKPKINGETLIGNKSASDLGLATSSQGAKADSAYQLPANGIPSTDMDSSVQASLGKADTAIQDVSGKADKVSGATAGDFAGLDANGNLTDSGKKATDFATAAQGAKADSAYQKPSGGIPASDLSSAVQTSLGKADAAAPQATTYTKTEVNNLLVPANTTIQVVTELPASGSANTIYRVPGTNSYTDYGWDGTQFVPLATYTNGIDNVPTANSNNLVKSGGIWESSQLAVDVLGKISCKYGLTIGSSTISTLNNYPLWYYKALSDVKVKLTYDKKATDSYAGKICIVQSESDIVNGTSITVLHNINSVTTYTETYTLNAGQCLCVGGHGTDVVQFQEMTIAPASDTIKTIISEIGAYDYTHYIVPNSTRYTNQGAGNTVGNLQGSSTLGTATIPVTNGDIFVIGGTGGGSPRLWCWVDASMKVISASDASVTETSLLLQTPAGAAYLIVNVNISNTYSILCYKAASILNSLKSINIKYKGLALPNTNPPLDGDLCYIANTAGTYAYMGNAVVGAGELHILQYVGGVWSDILAAKTIPCIYSSTTSNTATYERSVREVYTTLPDMNVYLKAYTSAIYLGTKTGSAKEVIARCPISDIVNGIPAPMVVYSSNASDFPIGYIAGYVVFNDIASFSPLSTTAQTDKVDYSVVSNKAYSPIIQSYLLSLGEAIKISLPDIMTAVVGDTLQVFYHGIIFSALPPKYNIVVTCDKGSQFPRYFEYTPTIADVGDVTFTISVKDDNRNVLATKSCTLRTVAKAESTASNVNVLCFGSSTTVGGEWPIEAHRRIAGSGGTPAGDGLSNVTFCGAKVVDGVGFYGVGGWNWNSYISKDIKGYRFQVTGVSNLSIGAKYSNNGNEFIIREINVTSGAGNILCTVTSLTPTPSASGTLSKVSGTGDATITYTSVGEDAANPLWDSVNDKMSFIPYANAYCNGQIDIVYCWLGFNGLGVGRTDFSTIISQVTTFADTLHTEFPNAKLKILGEVLPSYRGGMGANYGATGLADEYGVLQSIFGLSDAYQAFANDSNYSSFVEFVSVSTQFDVEYNMQHTQKAVNTRNSEVTEWMDTNGVHPALPGYLQVADVVYRNITKELQ